MPQPLTDTPLPSERLSEMPSVEPSADPPDGMDGLPLDQVIVETTRLPEESAAAATVTFERGLATVRAPLPAFRRCLPDESKIPIVVPSAEDLASVTALAEPGNYPAWSKLSYVPPLENPDGGSCCPRSLCFECVMGALDERQALAFDPAFIQYPWDCVGRVRNDGSSLYGTGCLVGPRHVLTASHNILPVGDGGEAAAMFFEPGFNCACWLGKWPVQEIWLYEYVDPSIGMDEFLNDLGVVAATQLIHDLTNGDLSKLNPTGMVACDMAVLVLEHPIGDLVGYVGHTPFQDSWITLPVWQHVGYPFEKCPGGKRPYYHGGSRFGESIPHNCDTKFDSQALMGDYDSENGHSGGPVWGWFADTLGQVESFPRIVATHSMGCMTPDILLPDSWLKKQLTAEALHFRLTGNFSAGGNALSALIAAAKQGSP